MRDRRDVQRVRARASIDRAAGRRDAVVAITSIDRISAIACVNGVVAAAADQRVIARAALDGVVARASVDVVVGAVGRVGVVDVVVAAARGDEHALHTPHRHVVDRLAGRRWVVHPGDGAGSRAPVSVQGVCVRATEVPGAGTVHDQQIGIAASHQHVPVLHVGDSQLGCPGTSGETVVVVLQVSRRPSHCGHVGGHVGIAGADVHLTGRGVQRGGCHHPARVAHVLALRDRRDVQRVSARAAVYRAIGRRDAVVATSSVDSVTAT